MMNWGRRHRRGANVWVSGFRGAPDHNAIEAYLAFKFEELEEKKKPVDEAGQKALMTYCHTIFNTAEFLYVD